MKPPNVTKYTLKIPIDADYKSKKMCSSDSLSKYICLGTFFLGQAVCICMFRDLCPANQYLKPKYAPVFCVQVSSSTWSSREGLCFFFQICCTFARSHIILQSRSLFKNRTNPLLISTDFLKYPFWHLFQTLVVTSSS